MAEASLDFESISALDSLVSDKANVQSSEFAHKNGAFDIAEVDQANGVKSDVESSLDASTLNDQENHESPFTATTDDHNLDNGFPNSSFEGSDMHLPLSEPDTAFPEHQATDVSNEDTELNFNTGIEASNNVSGDQDDFSLRLRDDSELEDRGENGNPESELDNFSENNDTYLDSNATLNQETNDLNQETNELTQEPASTITNTNESTECDNSQENLDFMGNLAENDLHISSSVVSDNILEDGEQTGANDNENHSDSQQSHAITDEGLGFSDVDNNFVENESMECATSENPVSYSADEVENESSKPDNDPINDNCLTESTNSFDTTEQVETSEFISGDPVHGADSKSAENPESIKPMDIDNCESFSASCELNFGDASTSVETEPVTNENLAAENDNVQMDTHDSILQNENVSSQVLSAESITDDAVNAVPSVSASDHIINDETERSPASESPQLPTPSSGAAPSAITPPIVPTSTSSVFSEGTNNGECSSGDNSNGEGKVSVGQGDVGVTEFNWEAVQCVYCHVLVSDQDPKLLPCLHSACHKCVGNEAMQPANKDEDILPSECFFIFICLSIS